MAKDDYDSKRRMNGNVNVWWPKGLHRMAKITTRLAKDRKIGVTKLIREVYCKWAASVDAEANEVWKDYQRVIED